MIFVLLLAGTASAEAKDYKDFKLAAVFQTAIEEPWDGAIHQACLLLQKELGFTYEFTEKVGAADFERVLREYAERGFDLHRGRRLPRRRGTFPPRSEGLSRSRFRLRVRVHLPGTKLLRVRQLDS